MFVLFVTLGGLALQGLVTANPLIQGTQSCPTTSYQQNPYQNPFSDPQFIIQPNNINPYLQPVLVQNPLPAHQLQASVKDQITQLYWDKILSNPTLRSILLPNSGIYNQNSNELQRIGQLPFNSGGVVNNYIIVPPEYLTVNKTTENHIKGRKIKKVKKLRKNANVINQNNKLNRCQVNRKHIAPNQVNTPNMTPSTDTKTGTVKSDSSKDKVDDVLTKKKKIIPRKGVDEKKYNEQEKTGKSMNDKLSPEGKVDSQTKREKKSKKLKENVSKAADFDNNKEDRKSNVNKKKKSSKRKKKDHEPKIEEEVNSCDCVEEDEILKRIQAAADNLNKMGEASNIKCVQDIDLLDINQDYIDLEKRRTRNSKNEAILTDFRNMYPDLPDDVSKSFAKYINDLMENPQAPNSNMFYPNNMYPFDFSQIYQTPQHSITEATKPNANRSRKRKNKRRKKQKSKKNSKKKKGEKDSSKDVTDTRKAEELVEKVDSAAAKYEPVKMSTSKIISTTEKTTTFTENTPTEAYISEEDVESFEEPVIHETPKEVKIESLETTSKLVVSTIKTTTAVIENMPEQFISEEEGIESFEEREIEPKVIESQEVKSGLSDINEKDVGVEKSDEILEIKEIFETQIPDTIQKVHEHKDIFGSYYEVPELGLEDELPHLFDNRIFNDYYPDFTADNHAYLLSREEFDIINVHDRYFYTTDKNIDSGEVNKNGKKIHSHHTSVEIEKHDHHDYKERNSNAENSNLDYDELQAKYNQDKVGKKYSSDEIVFRTPPGLDVPDFRTRKINKDRHDSTEIVYQHTNYDNYDRFNLDNMADRTESVANTAEYSYEKPDDKPQSLVETVYARSKVVKYGQSQDIDKFLSPSSHLAGIDDIQYGDTGKTIVIAKSLGPDEMW